MYCIDVVDNESEIGGASESKASKENIDLKEIKRVDHILASLQRKVAKLRLEAVVVVGPRPFTITFLVCYD